MFLIFSPYFPRPFRWLRVQVDVLPPFRRLRAECLRVYAELLAVLALTGAQEQTEDPLAEACADILWDSMENYRKMVV